MVNDNGTSGCAKNRVTIILIYSIVNIFCLAINTIGKDENIKTKLTLKQ